MIEFTIDGDLVTIRPKGKVLADDFATLALRVDAAIRQHGHIDAILVLDEFEGWDDLSAAKDHFGFIRDHHGAIQKLAIVGADDWKRLLLTALTEVLRKQHKFIRSEDEARRWIGT